MYRRWVEAYRPPNAHQSYFYPQIQTMPREQLRALQDERLRLTIQRAWDTVPFYRRKLDAAGAVPNDIKRRDDLRKIPPTTKSEFRESDANDPPFGSHRGASDWVRVIKSGGTTGKPPWTTPNWRDLVMEAEGAIRAYWRGGLRPGGYLISTYPATLGGALNFTPAVEMLSGAAYVSGGVLGDESTARFVIGAIADLGPSPKVLMATPTLFRAYLHWFERLSIPMSSLNWTGCFIAAEPGLASPDVRRQYEDQVGCKVFDMGGTTDVFTISCSECSEQNGMHLAEDHVLLEVLDVDTGEPVGPGERGQALLTNLTKSVNISVRFDPDDIVSYDESECACGETHMKIRIWGRKSDIVSIAGSVILPSDVEAVIRRHPGVGIGTQFQLIRQTPPPQEVLVVRLERSSQSGSDLARELESALQTDLRVKSRIEVVEPGSMSRNATGYKAPLVVTEPLERGAGR